jgi:hypothetical protein
MYGHHDSGSDVADALLVCLLEEHAELTERAVKFDAWLGRTNDEWRQQVESLQAERDILSKRVAELDAEKDFLAKQMGKTASAWASQDDPSLDGTPNAHPAFWRGYAACVEEVHDANQFHPRNEAIIYDVMGDLVDFLRASIPKTEPKP